MYSDFVCVVVILNAFNNDDYLTGTSIAEEVERMVPYGSSLKPMGIELTSFGNSKCRKHLMDVHQRKESMLQHR